MTDLYMKLYMQYNNINFLLPIKETYSTVGRTQTEAEALWIQDLFKSTCEKKQIKYLDLESITHKDLPQVIFNYLKQKEEKVYGFN